MRRHAGAISVKGAIRHGKRSKGKTYYAIRDVDMLPIVKEALKRQWLETGARGGRVFITATGELKHSWQIGEIWHQILRACLLDSRCLYTTRHTFASIMLSAGEDIMWVTKMMGHKDPSTTFKNYAAFIKMKEKRAEFLDSFGVCTDFTQNLHTPYGREKLKA